MTPEPDFYSLMMGDEPSAQEQAMAYAAALRGQRQRADAQQQLGLVGQLSGDRVLSGVGKSLQGAAQNGYEQVQGGQKQLAQMAETRLQRSIQAKRDQELAAYHQGLLERPDFQITKAGDGSTVQQERHSGEYKTIADAPPPRPVLGRSLGRGGGGAELPVSQEAIDQLAEQFHTTGTLPSLGTGAAGTAAKMKIANRAAELHPQASLAGNHQSYRADTGSLTKLQTTADAMETFEKTGLKNLDVALQQASKIGDVGIPLLNAPYRKVQTMLGNTDMSAYNAARQTAVGEIGKLLAGSMGSGGLSDGARHEVETLIAPDASLAQIRAAADILKKDVANRKASVHEQLQTIRGRTGGSQHGAPASGGPSVTERRSLPDGRVIELLSDGTKRLAQ